MSNKKLNPFAVKALTVFAVLLFLSSVFPSSANPASPTIGEFQAPSTAYAQQYFFLNATINDADGVADFVNATVELSNGIILKWVKATNAFSEYQDTNNYCALDAVNSLRTSVNSTAYKLSWKIKLTWTFPEGLVNIVATNTKVFSTDGSGSNSKIGLFAFEDDLIVASASVDDSRVNPSDAITVSGTVAYEGVAFEEITFEGVNRIDGMAVAEDNLIVFARSLDGCTLKIYFGDDGETLVETLNITKGIAFQVANLGDIPYFQGSVWFGTYSCEPEGIAELYRIDIATKTLILVKNWTGTHRHIHDVSVSDDTIIVALGDLGYLSGIAVMRSTDLGISWTNIFTECQITSLCWNSDNDAWYIGSEKSGDRPIWVYKSVDNGDNWTLLSDPEQDHSYATSIIAWGSNIVLTTGYDPPHFIISIDDGATWTTYTPLETGSLDGLLRIGDNIFYGQVYYGSCLDPHTYLYTESNPDEYLGDLGVPFAYFKGYVYFTGVGASIYRRLLLGGESSGLSFDGINDYVTLPSTGLDLTGDMTIAFWLNGIYAYNKMILIRSNALENNGFWIQEKADNTLRAYWVNVAGGLKVVVGKNNIITDNAWQRIVVVKSGTTGIIYVNAVDQTLSSDVLVNPVTQNVITYIGSELGTGAFLTASLDEVLMYSVAKNYTWVSKDYQGDHSYDETGLVLHLPFDGDTQDYSGLGNHGTNYGATWTTGKKVNVQVKINLGATNKRTLSVIEADGSYSFPSFNAESAVGSYAYTIYAATDQNSVQNQTVNVIVDRIIISDKGVTDDRTNMGEYEQYWFELASEVDGVPVEDGTVTLNGTLSATWVLAHLRWEYNTTKSSVQKQSLYPLSVNWLSQGITNLADQSGNYTGITWDIINVTSLTASQITVPTGYEVKVWATALLAYNGHSLGTGDTLVINGYEFTWDSLMTRWELAINKDIPQKVIFDALTNTSLEATYGISIGATQQNLTLEWYGDDDGDGTVLPVNPFEPDYPIIPEVSEENLQKLGVAFIIGSVIAATIYGQYKNRQKTWKPKKQKQVKWQKKGKPLE